MTSARENLHTGLVRSPIHTGRAHRKKLLVVQGNAGSLDVLIWVVHLLMERIGLHGAGPAGVAAADYSQRNRFHVALL